MHSARSILEYVPWEKSQQFPRRFLKFVQESTIFWFGFLSYIVSKLRKKIADLNKFWGSKCVCVLVQLWIVAFIAHGGRFFKIMFAMKCIFGPPWNFKVFLQIFEIGFGFHIWPIEKTFKVQIILLGHPIFEWMDECVYLILNKKVIPIMKVHTYVLFSEWNVTTSFKDVYNSLALLLLFTYNWSGFM